MAALAQIGLPLYLAKADIRQRYRRSILGPWWITISTGVMIACIGVIFGTIFKSPMQEFLPFLSAGLIIWGFISTTPWWITISTGVMIACIGVIFGTIFKSPMQEFLPFLSAGLIIWGFISTTVMDATNVLISAEAIIKQLPIPVFSHILRMVSKNLIVFFHNLLIFPILIVFFHNLLIFPIVCICVQKGINWNIFYFIPGLIILTLNLLWISLLLAVICTRFRDMTQIVESLLQIAFYITPIIWMPSLLPARASIMLLDPNPFYHLLAIVREPLIGVSPNLTNWLVSIGLLFIGTFFSLLLFDKYRARISYWL